MIKGTKKRRIDKPLHDEVTTTLAIPRILGKPKATEADTGAHEGLRRAWC